ncbi:MULTISPECIES: hypothetical protein [unclassified Amycolatopsis]|uniref:hypothetical protein n=1 Tax=unclassified Amycolatopsis TaxID=2618356 RepID=UPI001C6A71EB|nr:hypothetical protein [Amycolatopsis sp. DSM 110486]QYN24310.1 hypothetical protein K1T34_18815 [Amycolatopsis sp. DSM 110486]
MNVSEDELEQRLRTLFSDDRLGVAPPADAAPAIMAGARRRRQRRKVLMSASGAVCALALVSGGLVVFKFQATTGTADLTASRLTVPNVSAPPPVAPVTAASPPAAEDPPVAPPVAPSHVSSAPPNRHSPPPATRGDAPDKVTKGPLLTADGLGVLKLGMTEEQLTDSGLTLTQVKESAGCTYYDVAGEGVPAATAVVSPDAGVVVVKPDGAAHTPEGVGEGSAKEDVTAAYPGTSQASDGLVAPTGDEGAYHFTLADDGSVSSLDVRSVNQTCAG